MRIPGKIVAVGRNYGKHALELGNEIPKEPIIFMKPSSSIITEGQKIRFPPKCRELHHEVELGIVIGKTCQNISPNEVLASIKGFVPALDLTDRHLQTHLKQKGLPWTLAKGFDTSCPIGAFVPVQQLPDPHNVTLWLHVNQAEKQRGSTSDMIFSIPQLIAFISQWITLDPDDLVLTGTPDGVGPIVSKDKVDFGIAGFPTATFYVD